MRQAERSLSLPGWRRLALTLALLLGAAQFAGSVPARAGLYDGGGGGAEDHDYGADHDEIYQLQRGDKICRTRAECGFSASREAAATSDIALTLTSTFASAIAVPVGRSTPGLSTPARPGAKKAGAGPLRYGSPRATVNVFFDFVSLRTYQSARRLARAISAT